MSFDSDTGTESGSKDDVDALLPEEFQDILKLRKLFMGKPLNKEDHQKLTVHTDFCFSLRCLVICSFLGKILLYSPAVSALSTSEVWLFTFDSSQVWGLECFS